MLACAETLDTCGLFARDIGTFARVADVLFGKDADAAAGPACACCWPSGLVSNCRHAEAAPRWRATVARIEAVLGHATPVDVADRPLSDACTGPSATCRAGKPWQADGALIENYGLQMGPGRGRALRCSARGSPKPSSSTASAVRSRVHARTWVALLGHDGVLVMPTMPDIARCAPPPARRWRTTATPPPALLCLAAAQRLPATVRCRSPAAPARRSAFPCSARRAATAA